MRHDTSSGRSRSVCLDHPQQLELGQYQQLALGCGGDIQQLQVLELGLAVSTGVNERESCEAKQELCVCASSVRSLCYLAKAEATRAVFAVW